VVVAAHRPTTPLVSLTPRFLHRTRPHPFGKGRGGFGLVGSALTSVVHPVVHLVVHPVVRPAVCPVVRASFVLPFVPSFVPTSLFEGEGRVRVF
jgi:hypothetical protein